MGANDQNGLGNAVPWHDREAPVSVETHERGGFDGKLLRPEPVSNSGAVFIFRYDPAFPNHVRHRLRLSKTCDSPEIIPASTLGLDERRQSIANEKSDACIFQDVCAPACSVMRLQLTE